MHGSVCYMHVGNARQRAAASSLHQHGCLDQHLLHLRSSTSYPYGKASATPSELPSRSASPRDRHGRPGLGDAVLNPAEPRRMQHPCIGLGAPASDALSSPRNLTSTGTFTPRLNLTPRLNHLPYAAAPFLLIQSMRVRTHALHGVPFCTLSKPPTLHASGTEMRTLHVTPTHRTRSIGFAAAPRPPSPSLPHRHLRYSGTWPVRRAVALLPSLHVCNNRHIELGEKP